MHQETDNSTSVVSPPPSTQTPPRHPNPLRSNPNASASGLQQTGSHSSVKQGRQRTKRTGNEPPSSNDLSSSSEDHSSGDDYSDDASDKNFLTQQQGFEMAERPAYHRPTDGRSGTPLLVSQTNPTKDDAHHRDDRGRTRSKYGHNSPSAHLTPRSSPPPPSYSRNQSSHTHHSFTARQTLRSVSPATIAAQGEGAVRQKWTIAGIFLVITLVSFCVQTELAKIVQTDMGWDKAYCMLYLTHGSWSLLYPTQLLFLRLQKRRVPWTAFWRSHWKDLMTTAWEVKHQKLSHSRSTVARGSQEETELKWYLLRTTAIVTTSLTVAGLSWYIAVNLTSPSDLTAIYNCSAFFAYAFSVPLLKEPLRMDKSIAVLIAIVGVLVVAYGDSSAPAGTDEQGEGNKDPSAGSRFLGNMVIGVGSVLYGLYEVLYKRLACPPEGASAMRSVVFANTYGACIGAFTLSVLWIPLPFLNWLGWEIFELPTGKTALYLFLSVIMNATFAGSFLVLISLTSPVLSSVAALLTIFIVALADWALTGGPPSAAALAGGLLIVVAFGMLSWSSWREMSEHAKMREVEEVEGLAVVGSSSDDDGEGDSDSGADEAVFARHSDEEGRRMLPG
ncbi:hypothetical protein MKZ38_009421 [Zalerion maritima]|uniref:EamA domain-containing protein n=1 Tax=Zalerion maritima TaxID=339359 RepID=A0AAD5RGV3_9PEZI|nr:hypothetical protein MKZ38_009421 [Zalerion maritima]